MVWLFLTRKKCVFWHCAGVTGRHRGTVAASGACAEVNPLKSLIVAFDVEALNKQKDFTRRDCRRGGAATQILKNFARQNFVP